MPATNAWLRSRFLSSPGCRRIRSRQTSRVSAGSSASGPCSPSPRPGDGPVDAGRPQVDLAHLGRVAIADLGRARRRPAARRRPRVQRGRVGAARRRAARSPARPPSWPAACRPGRPAGSDRSASGCTRSRRARGRSAGTCRAGGWTRRAGRRGRPARPACRARRAGPGASRRGDRPAGQRGMEGVGDHGQIGQFGHGAAIVAVGRPVLDSPGPKGQDS